MAICWCIEFKESTINRKAAVLSWIRGIVDNFFRFCDALVKFAAAVKAFSVQVAQLQRDAVVIGMPRFWDQL